MQTLTRRLRRTAVSSGDFEPSEVFHGPIVFHDNGMENVSRLSDGARDPFTEEYDNTNIYDMLGFRSETPDGYYRDSPSILLFGFDPYLLCDADDNGDLRVHETLAAELFNRYRGCYVPVRANDEHLLDAALRFLNAAYVEYTTAQWAVRMTTADGYHLIGYRENEVRQLWNF